MLGKIAKWFTAMKKSVQSGLQRFPEAIIMAALTTITFIALNHIEQATFDTDRYDGVVDILGNLGMVLALGVAAFLVKSVLFERFRDKIWANHVISRPLSVILILALLTTYYFTLQADTDFVTGARYAALSASLYLIFLFLPYFWRRAHFEKYVLFVLLRFAITYLFASIIVGGFSAIILTIDALFPINIAGQLLPDVALVAFGIFAPIFFLSYIPKFEEDMEPVEYVSFLRILLAYIVMPILAIYTLVLIVYLLSILISTSWPKGIVSNMVLWFSLISTFILFITYPIREMNRWTTLFWRFFPMFLIPMLLMMFVAVGIRINAYGVTESRYIVVALGIWLFASMVYLSIGRNIRNIWLPITFVIFLIVSVFSPVNLFFVSKDSQNDRLEKILSKYEMLENGKFIKLPKSEIDKISESDREQIKAIFSYFYENHDVKDIRSVPSEFRLANSMDYFGYIWYGNQFYDETGKTQSYNHYLKSVEIVDVENYDSFIDFNNYNGENKTFKIGDLQIEYVSMSQNLRLTKNEVEIGNIEVRELAKEVHKKHKGKDQLSLQQMTSVFENEEVKLNIQFTSIFGMSDAAAKEITVDSASFYLLIDRK